MQQVILLSRDFDFEATGVDDQDGASSSTSTDGEPLRPEATNDPVHEPYGPGFSTCDRPLPPRYILTGGTC